jgi:hypothetical protein
MSYRPANASGDDIVRGNITGHTAVFVQGSNPDVDTATVPEDVWFNGGVYTGHPTGSPETVQVFSSSANDTSAGTGARTVRIYGLATSSSTAYTTEDLTMNGVTVVTSSGTWYRVNRMDVRTAGSGGTNAGNITCRHSTTTSNVFVLLEASRGRSAVGVWTVPQSSSLTIHNVLVHTVRSGGGAGSARVLLQVRRFGTSSWQSVRRAEIANAHVYRPNMFIPVLVEAQADIRFRCVSVSTNDTIISAQFDGVLIAA